MNKKNLDLNRFNKTTIVNNLASLYRNTGDADLSEKYLELKDKAQVLPDTDSEQARNVDVRILDILSVLSKTSPSEKNKLNMLLKNLDEEITERKALSIYNSIPLSKKDRRRQEKNNKLNAKITEKARKESEKFKKAYKNGKLTKEAVNARIKVDIAKIAELKDRSKRLQAECSELFKRLQKVYDVIDSTELNIKNAELQSVNAQIKNISVELETLNYKLIAEERAETGREAGIAVKGAAADVIVKAGENEKNERELESNIDAMRSAMSGNADSSRAQFVAEQNFAPFSAQTFEPQANPYANAVNPYEPVKTAGTVNSLEDYFEGIDEYIAALENAKATVESQRKQKNRELEKIKEKLSGLLLERKPIKGACNELDEDIDDVQKEFATVKRGMARIAQKRAVLSNKLSIVKGIRDVRDSAELEKQLDTLSEGKFTNFPSLAAALNKSTEAMNEEFENLNDAVAVADTPAIQNRTYAAVGNGYEAETKDEDKYAELERELGIR